MSFSDLLTVHTLLPVTDMTTLMPPSWLQKATPKILICFCLNKPWRVKTGNYGFSTDDLHNPRPAFTRKLLELEMTEEKK